MIVESFPALDMRDVELEQFPAPPRLRGPVLPSLSERLQLGGPVFVPISADYHADDADLQAFIRGSQERWVLAHLAVTFPPRDGPPLESATVQVNLGDSGQPAATIAFSILPLASGTPYERTGSFTLSPNVTIGAAAGISLGSAGTQIVQHGQDSFVIGDGELSAHPAWHFQPTPTQPLAGSNRLSMIVQVPAGRTGTISVDLSAQVRTGTFRRRQVPLAPDAAADGHVEATF